MIFRKDTGGSVALCSNTSARTTVYTTTIPVTLLEFVIDLRLINVVTHTLLKLNLDDWMQMAPNM